MNATHLKGEAKARYTVRAGADQLGGAYERPADRWETSDLGEALALAELLRQDGRAPVVLREDGCCALPDPVLGYDIRPSSVTWLRPDGTLKGTTL
jgi:hypothetical protein